MCRVQFQGAHRERLYWGTYRPNLYLGIRARFVNKTATSAIWPEPILSVVEWASRASSLASSLSFERFKSFLQEWGICLVWFFCTGLQNHCLLDWCGLGWNKDKAPLCGILVMNPMDLLAILHGSVMMAPHTVARWTTCCTNSIGIIYIWVKLNNIWSWQYYQRQIDALQPNTKNLGVEFWNTIAKERQWQRHGQSMVMMMMMMMMMSCAAGLGMEFKQDLVERWKRSDE